MYDCANHGKVRNEKVLRWRVELSAFDFKISYRPGKLNVPLDTLSRVFCAVTQVTSLQKIYESLCHPVITRFLNFLRAKNMPFFVEDVRKTVGNCGVCSEIKHQFHSRPVASLVKVTQPFEHHPLTFLKGRSHLHRKIITYSRLSMNFRSFPLCSPIVTQMLRLLLNG